MGVSVLRVEVLWFFWGWLMPLVYSIGKVAARVRGRIYIIGSLLKRQAAKG
jgi:hypothetical protein